MLKYPNSFPETRNDDMNDDLQQLLERIQKEGVDTASAKAETLMTDARA